MDVADGVRGVVGETLADGEPEGERDRATVDDAVGDADGEAVLELESVGERDVDAHAV